jgi:hypothetical protein
MTCSRVAIALVAACLLLGLAAGRVRAQTDPAFVWDQWRNLGGQIQDPPSCVSWGPNRIDCFSRGFDRSMHHWWWETANGDYNSGWHGPQGLGGELRDPPNCVSWGPNRIDCFGRGTDNGLWRTAWTGGGWTGWLRMSGTILEAPSCPSWGPNRIDCFARGGDRAMYHWWWDGARWNGWEKLGGELTSPPNCVGVQANRLDCFALGTDGFAYRHRWDGAQWIDWRPIGDGRRLRESPTCLEFAGRMKCVGRLSNPANTAEDGSPVFALEGQDGRWTGWQVFFQPIRSRFSCVVDDMFELTDRRARQMSENPSQMRCFATGRDRGLMQWDHVASSPPNVRSPWPEHFGLHFPFEPAGRGDIPDAVACIAVLRQPVNPNSGNSGRDTFCFARGRPTSLNWRFTGKNLPPMLP